ncbi:MAG: hypothetical protein ACE5HS_06890 [bacterium]
MGGSISTLYPAADVISSNPAGLGFAHGFHITLDWAPPLTINPAGIFGIENRINDQLVESAANNNPPIDPITGKTDPESVVDKARVNADLSMRGGLKGGALMYGVPYFTIAASFHQPFRFATEMNVSGIEFLASSLDDQGKDSIRMFGTINGNLNLNFNIATSSIGFGTRVLPNLSIGMVYDNFNGDLNFEGTFLPEGIISSAGGETKSFNSPASIEYDSLFAVIKGDWEGNGFRMRWGVGYHPMKNISLDATVTLPVTLDLHGPFSMVHNDIRALNLGAGEDEDVIDADIFLEDNLTKTQKRITKINGIDIEIPGSATFGFSAKWDNYVASIVYTSYFSQLGYKFSYQQFDSLNVKFKEGDIHQGIDLGSAVRLGIGVKPLILGLGVLFAKSFREENIEIGANPTIADKKNIFIPFFSLGGGIKIGPRFNFDYILNFYNSSFLRFSTSYRL